MTGHRRNGKPHRSQNERENNLNDALDELTIFEEFKAKILPELRKDIAAGLSTDALLKKYEKFATARAITIAITEQDSGKALAAVKDIVDRQRGKPTENKTVRHKFEDVDDAQLEALITAKLTEEAEDDGESDEALQ